MIRRIAIKNFKSIKSADIGLRNLTLLFGMNGMGKSTTIQSILLCRQSYWKNEKRNMNFLYPNGGLIELGTASDIFCANVEDDRILFEFEYDNGINTFQFDFPANEPYANKISVEGSGTVLEAPEYGNDFVYLSAEHLGPRRKYDFSGWNNDGINKLGMHGEFAVPFLAMHGNKFIVPEELCIPEAKSNSLIDQVSAWMGLISPGVRLNTELIEEEQEAKLKVSYNEEWLVSKSYTPVNVGFGIPYVLPLIVAVLTAGKDSLILIENPESHLHPKGQTAMATLIATAASYGVQIICESHSDHIINGVRVAVKEKCITNKEVAILYYANDHQLNSKITQIRVDANGNLDNYPEGLLDEWGELMARLI